MHINQIFELTMVLDNDKFHKILDKVFRREGYLEENGEEYIDQSLVSKGIIVKYRDSRYKKKIKLIINSGVGIDCDKLDCGKFIRKLEKRINQYFDNKYCMNDFDLSGVTFIADIDVSNRKNVSSYLQVLQRIGKVKGFSPASYEYLDENSSFCLVGNSNAIECLMYDLERVVLYQHKDVDLSRKKLSLISEKTEGIIRVEIRLSKPKAIQSYTDSISLAEQIKELIKKNENIFLDILVRIVPYGDYYKKDKAVEIVRSEVEDSTLRRRMLQLLSLIPEKKSLYLAQKAMNCRNVEKVMEAFAMINVSPITISKRQDVKHLKCIYEYLI